jgi:F0F1-type ATP synthase assembly protein I
VTQNPDPERTGARTPDVGSPNNGPKGQDEAGKQKFLMAAAHYISVASSLPAAIIAGYGIGYFLDLWLHTTFLKIVFLVLGIVAGFMDLIRQLMKDMRRKG